MLPQIVKSKVHLEKMILPSSIVKITLNIMLHSSLIQTQQNICISKYKNINIQTKPWQTNPCDRTLLG